MQKIYKNNFSLGFGSIVLFWFVVIIQIMINTYAGMYEKAYSISLCVMVWDLAGIGLDWFDYDGYCSYLTYIIYK